MKLDAYSLCRKLVFTVTVQQQQPAVTSAPTSQQQQTVYRIPAPTQQIISSKCFVDSEACVLRFSIISVAEYQSLHSKSSLVSIFFHSEFICAFIFNNPLNKILEKKWDSCSFTLMCCLLVLRQYGYTACSRWPGHVE